LTGTANALRDDEVLRGQQFQWTSARKGSSTKT